MKHLVLSICLAFICSISYAQTDSTPNRKSFDRNYFVDTLQSDFLQQKRIIKVYLPQGYQAANKYPVIYVLDENWMFEPTVSDVIKLSNFKIIPPCIVVGISSPNRSNDLRPNLTTGVWTEYSKNFNDYLTLEVPQFITRKYTSPVFNILVGHSDGATFAHTAMISKPAAFRGVICLSQNLFGNELDEYIHYSKRDFGKNNYYFVASGTRDATSRIRAGKKLDSLFHLNTNPQLKLRHDMYEADHSGVAGMGLANGIAFVFSDYYQPSGWNGPLADSLRKINMDPTALIENTMARINDNYGIEAKPSDDGILDLAFVIIKTKEQAYSYLDYRKRHTKTDANLNSTSAQLFERINEYDIALSFWTAYLNDPASYKEHFFYFRRPIELLAFKMNQPERAIAFAEEWEKTAPANIKLSFKFFIAKIAADKNTSRKKGKEYIDYFIKNFDIAKTTYTLEEAKLIQESMQGKRK